MRKSELLITVILKIIQRDNISLWMDPNPQPLEDREVYKAAICMIEWCSPGERQLARYISVSCYLYISVSENTCIRGRVSSVSEALDV